MKTRDRTDYRKKFGTPEWLIDKWTNKIWKTYSLYSDKGDCVLPSFLRKEFEKDLNIVIEYKIKEIAPEKSLIN